ncbi:hypothetical protein DFH09DRAFT_915610, partial [Mycena vulgaris]
VIAPTLFQPYPMATNKWSLSTLMHVDGTLVAKLEEHYDMFIVCALPPSSLLTTQI